MSKNDPTSFFFFFTPTMKETQKRSTVAAAGQRAFVLVTARSRHVAPRDNRINPKRRFPLSSSGMGRFFRERVSSRIDERFGNLNFELVPCLIRLFVHSPQKKSALISLLYNGFYSLLRRGIFWRLKISVLGKYLEKVLKLASIWRKKYT